MKIEPMETVVRNHLQSALEAHDWNKTRVALALELDRRTVLRMVQRFKLTPRAPEPVAELLLRCQECGAVSEPGETDPSLVHTHSCPLGAA